MPKYAEIIFETGSHSLASYDDESEIVGFVKEQQRRAIAGEPGGPTGHPAERVSRVLLYNDHPADTYPLGVDAATVKTLIDGMTGSDGRFDPNQLISAVRDEVSPIYTLDPGKHESYWKSPEDSEMDLSFLSEGEAA